jgi:hypothetical protein
MGSSGEMMEYQTYVPWPLNVGDDVLVEGVTWFCLEPCRLIGATIDDQIPVLGNGATAVLATTQLIKASDCPTRPTPGLVRTANMTLMEYEQITLGDLAGKQIKAAHRDCDEIIIITTEKQYIKLVSEYEDRSYFAEVLTMEDLWTMKLLGAKTYDRYMSECGARHKEQRLTLAIARFKEAAANVGLGIEIVKELLDKPE